jgi:hypothetical protein
MNAATNVYCSIEGSLNMYVGHHPTIRMLLLKLNIQPKKNHCHALVKLKF